MTDWSPSDDSKIKTTKYSSQHIFNIIKGGNNIMMPGTRKDYNIIIDNLKKSLITREDLLQCSSKVYETIKLLNK